jgi:hypothetical protein
MNKILKQGAPFVLLCLLMACSCGKSPLAVYGPDFATIMRTDTGLFRGISMGRSKEVIKALEPSGLKEADSSDGTDYLFYELKIDSTISYTIAYNCPDNKLNNIAADIYLLNEPQASTLYDSFKAYFEKKYGSSLADGDFLLWTIHSSGSTTRIELADESPTYKRGKITLVIRNATEL